MVLDRRLEEVPHLLSYPPGVPHSRGHGQVTQIVSWTVSCSGMCPVHKKYGARGAIFSSSCVLRGCRHLEGWNNPCHASGQASLEGPWELRKNIAQFGTEEREPRLFDARALTHRGRNQGRAGRAHPQSTGIGWGCLPGTDCGAPGWGSGQPYTGE